ncbi:hypothetical protein BDR03DRAFT_971391 [Suillus americanus]|nr:hypothetical protein BDR03DRAFT_971391 [Suillus americanus]
MISLCALFYFGVIALISSINSRHGATRWASRLKNMHNTRHTLASSNVSHSVFSDSQRMLDTIDRADIMLMNGYLVLQLLRSLEESCHTPEGHETKTTWRLHTSTCVVDSRSE